MNLIENRYRLSNESIKFLLYWNVTENMSFVTVCDIECFISAIAYVDFCWLLFFFQSMHIESENRVDQYYYIIL